MKNIYRQILLNKNILPLDATSNSDTKISNAELGGMLLSFSSVGFTLDKESIELLKKYSADELKDFYLNSMNVLKEAKGDNANHVVFYKNFPNLEKMSELEYVLNAVLHYFTVSENSYGYMPNDVKKKVKNYLKEKTKLTVLKVMTEQECNKVLIAYTNNMFESKKAIPLNAQYALKQLVNDFSYFISPNEIPFKENLAFYFNCMCDFALNLGVSEGTLLSNINLGFIKTSTDLLRVYVAISDGDVMLIKNTKFKSLNRTGRKVLLSKLEEIASKNEGTIDDMSSHNFLWKKALEKLHIGDYSNVFVNAYKVATQLRNDEYTTYNALVVKAYKEKHIVELLRLLSIKPGVFARSLDYVVRNLNEYSNVTIEAFAKIANKVSNSLLIQLWEFYKNRNLYDTRIFVVKGPLNSFVKEIEDNREIISEETTNKIIEVLENALKENFSKKEMIEDVYLDECMKNYMIPSNNRNASGGYRTLTFGSKIKLEVSKKPVLRFFTHWKNSKSNNGRVDIDLSVQLYDKDFNLVSTLAWHNMDGGINFNSYHSGDITSAPNGASEFIDLDYKTAKNFGKYAIVCNNVFTGQDFADIPECFSGVMFREQKGKAGEIFEADKVKCKFDLTQRGSSQNLAFAIDLETLEMIWIDYPYTRSQCYAVAQNSNLSLVMLLKRALQKHMSIYDLVMLHENHLDFSKSKTKAKFLIDDSEKSNLSPYDIEKISSEWL